MIFQSLDDKSECVGLYIDDKLLFNQLPSDLSLTHTWQYSPSMELYGDIECANLYCAGQSIGEVCPEHLQDNWSQINGKLKAYFRSFSEAKVSLEDNCFFDLVPHQFLLEYCEIKNKITKHVFDNYEKPQDYDFLFALAKFIAQVDKQRLTIEKQNLKPHLHKLKARNFAKKINKTTPYCKYNLFGTKTGRLTTKKDSFPVLTLDKDYRDILIPSNNAFVEIDFNAAELRTLLALSGHEQPDEDLHAWNAKHIYEGLISRDEAKKKVFAWLYNPESKDYHLENYYDRELGKQKYWDGEYVRTIFGREIRADDHYALNYIVQSTASDMFLRQILKINELLKDKQSFIAFCLHDSFIIDLAREERNLLYEIAEKFSQTNFGDFKVNIKIGKNYGEMKEVRL